MINLTRYLDIFSGNISIILHVWSIQFILYTRDILLVSISLLGGPTVFHFRATYGWNSVMISTTTKTTLNSAFQSTF